MNKFRSVFKKPSLIITLYWLFRMDQITNKLELLELQVIVSVADLFWLPFVLFQPLVSFF